MDRRLRKQQESQDGEAWKSSGKSIVKVRIKGRSAVDEDSGLGDETHIVDRDGQLFNSVLNMSDVTTGQNSYYMIQLLKHDSKKLWYVYRKWGRVGTRVGSTKLSLFRAEHTALQEFERVYYEKTGNEWKDLANFVKRPACFYPVELDYSTKQSVDLQKNQKEQKASKLHPRLQEVIKALFDEENMNHTLLELEIDTERLPLGKLSKKHILKGFSTLTAIQKLLTQRKSEKRASKLIEESNKFYTVIPHRLSRTYAYQIIDSSEKLEAKVQALQALQDMELVTTLRHEASFNNQLQNPIDRHYATLRTEFDLVPAESHEAQVVSRYVKNTHAPTHTAYKLELLNLFRVRREGEATSLQEQFGEETRRILLWHGSRTSNFAGILSNGLRIAPKEAPSTGFMFGKGVYFADMVSKSANYCFPSPGENEWATGFLLLCEVAVGKSKELKRASYIENLPQPYMSTFGIGRTHPNPVDREFLDGAEVPLGKPVKQQKGEDSSLLYNEFVVYDVSQIRVRYLVHLKFDFSRASTLGW